MLYSLIERNPGRDILLHVSANNPAMVRSFSFILSCLNSKDVWYLLFFITLSFPLSQLLYNRFGFKAEEFIVGFYEDYLDSESRASKNAFRLRLRA